MKHEEDGEDELAVLKDETRRAVRTAEGIRARRLTTQFTTGHEIKVLKELHLHIYSIHLDIFINFLFSHSTHLHARHSTYAHRLLTRQRTNTR